MKPALIALDRDGVLNELWYDADLGTVDSPARPDQVRVRPEAVVAVRRANRAGIPVVVVSNQPGVAKGKMTRRLLGLVTTTIVSRLAEGGAHLDRIYYCLHHPHARIPELRADCACRKPRPGMLLKAAADFGVRPSDSWFLGDTATDVSAGAAAGFHTGWLGDLRCDHCPTRCGTQPDLVEARLDRALATILAGR